MRLLVHTQCINKRHRVLVRLSQGFDICTAHSGLTLLALTPKPLSVEGVHR